MVFCHLEGSSGCQWDPGCAEKRRREEQGVIVTLAVQRREEVGKNGLSVRL